METDPKEIGISVSYDADIYTAKNNNRARKQIERAVRLNALYLQTSKSDAEFNSWASDFRAALDFDMGTNDQDERVLDIRVGRDTDGDTRSIIGPLEKAAKVKPGTPEFYTPLQSAVINLSNANYSGQLLNRLVSAHRDDQKYNEWLTEKGYDKALLLSQKILHGLC